MGADPGYRAEMSLWERLTAIFKREAADVAGGLAKAGQALDDELARKERELEATPAERMEMILEEQQAQDAHFQELTDRVLGSHDEGGPDPGSDPAT